MTAKKVRQEKPSIVISAFLFQKPFLPNQYIRVCNIKNRSDLKVWDGLVEGEGGDAISCSLVAKRASIMTRLLQRVCGGRSLGGV